jgi:uncharacterized protein with HEPN domain
MSRDHRLYLDDILEAIGRIQEYVAGYDQEAFIADRRTQDAVVRNLEVIGEAANRLPGSIRDLAPQIEWRKIIALPQPDVSIVWDVVTNKLGELERACRRILAHLEGPGEEG